ncbi:phosphatase 2C 67 [Spatholobus suberectus]|nr:phosphatase 2C 67 [Spatholobus suberectus]
MVGTTEISTRCPFKCAKWHCFLLIVKSCSNGRTIIVVGAEPIRAKTKSPSYCCLNLKTKSNMHFCMYHNMLKGMIRWCYNYMCLGIVVNIRDAKANLAQSTITYGSQNHIDGVHALKAVVLTKEHKPIFPQERAHFQNL